MQLFGMDRTLSARGWSALGLGAIVALAFGIGLGVLIGELTAEPPPEAPQSASATILPDVAPAPAAQPAPPQAAVASDALAAADNTARTYSPDTRQTEEPSAAPPAAEPQPVEPPAPVQAPPPQEAQSVLVAAPAVSPPVETAPVIEAKPAEAKPAAETKPAQHARQGKRLVKGKVAEQASPPAAGGPHWVVQLGAFQSAEHANLLVNMLATHGQPSHVNYVKDSAGQGWFYVQTPAYRSAAQAKEAAQRLGAREHLPTYLIRLPPDAG